MDTTEGRKNHVKHVCSCGAMIRQCRCMRRDATGKVIPKEVVVIENGCAKCKPKVQ